MAKRGPMTTLKVRSIRQTFLSVIFRGAVCILQIVRQDKFRLKLPTKGDDTLSDVDGYGLKTIIKKAYPAVCQP